MRQQVWMDPDLTPSRSRLGGLAQPQRPFPTACGVLGLALMASGPAGLTMLCSLRMLVPEPSPFLPFCLLGLHSSW